MKPSTLRVFASLLLFAATSPALAAEEPFVIADASASPRFMSLEPVRAGIHNNGLRAVPAMRSDKQALQNGFMRIDRATLRPTYNYRAPTASVSKGVTVLRGATAAAAPASEEDTDITALFAPAATGTAASFTDALGGSNRASYGRVRHAWPLPARVAQKFTSGFGQRADPFTGRPSFHGGIDISAAVGTPILASAEGTVTKVSIGKGLGQFVAVQHRDGSESYYGHLSAQSVRVGQRVMQGQQLGALGSTGRSTGPHLDYRIKRNGENFNPMTVLRAPLSVDTRVASR